MDEAGFSDIAIIGSGGLDEYDLSEFSGAQIPFDSYGVRTKMGTSSDAPWSDMAYKLVEYGEKPVLKRSPGKISWPGAKQLFRQRNYQGQFEKDIVGLRNERIAGTETLLKKVMESGRLVEILPTFPEPSRFSRRDWAPCKSNKSNPRSSLYPVEFSPELARLREETERKLVKP